MERVRILAVLLLLISVGCQSVNGFGATGGAITAMAEGASGAIIGRNFQGEIVPVENRGNYASMGVFCAGFLPFALVLDGILAASE